MINNLTNRIRDFFRNKKDSEKNWIEQLLDLGFKELRFPILILGYPRKGINFELVYNLEDFALDPDLYYFPWRDYYEILDSQGNLWKFRYDIVNKTNVPEKKIESLNLNDTKQKVKSIIYNYKKENELILYIHSANTIEDLFQKLKIFLKQIY